MCALTKCAPCTALLHQTTKHYTTISRHRIQSFILYRVPNVIMKKNQGLFKDSQAPNDSSPDINFPGLNVDISSYQYTLRDISANCKTACNQVETTLQ